jgi:hypothetical protein
MDWADYLRDEAAKYRQLAETSEDVSIKQTKARVLAISKKIIPLPILSRSVIPTPF